MSSTFLYVRPTDLLHYCFQNKGWTNSGHSTWPSCLGSSRHTGGLVGDVRQARQAASKFGQPTISEQLMDGGGFSHSSCGDHRHCPEQSTAAGTGGAQDRTLWNGTNSMREDEWTGKMILSSFIPLGHLKGKKARKKKSSLVVLKPIRRDDDVY